MQAIHMTATGPAAEVLQLVDIPEHGITSPTEIKIRIKSAGSEQAPGRGPEPLRQTGQ